MISTCGIYSVVYEDCLNAPFVALNDDDAMKICAEAFKDAICSIENYELHRIGTLHFKDGIIDTDRVFVTGFSCSDFVKLLDDSEEEVLDDEISTSV